MSSLQAAVLGAVQGLTEFIPVSSSAHLMLAPWLLRWPDPGRSFDAALHLGTLAAVLVFFRRDWVDMSRAALREPGGPRGRLAWSLVWATVPGAVLGLALSRGGGDALRSPPLQAAALAGFGLLLGWAYARGKRERGIEAMRLSDALWIGGAQALALVPGVSRSGVTITAGLLLGLTPEAAARFSFLLSMPITLGAGLHEARHLTAAELAGPFWIGVIVSAATGMAAIGIVLKSLPARVSPFVAYRVLLAAAILAVWFLRG